MHAVMWLPEAALINKREKVNSQQAGGARARLFVYHNEH